MNEYIDEAIYSMQVSRLAQTGDWHVWAWYDHELDRELAIEVAKAFATTLPQLVPPCQPPSLPHIA